MKSRPGMEVTALIGDKVQINDIKPLGSVWPERAVKKVKREDKEQAGEQEQRRRQTHDENDDRDDNSVDEYA